MLIPFLLNIILFIILIFLAVYSFSIIYRLHIYGYIFENSIMNFTKFKYYICATFFVLIFEIFAAALYIFIEKNKVTEMLDILLSIAHFLPFLLLWHRVRFQWKRIKNVILNRYLNK